MVKMLRVDDRLIHGQVAMLWSAFLKIDTIVVANDKAAGNQLTIMALSLAKPSDCKLEIKSVNDAVAYLNDEANVKKEVFVVVENTNDALAVVKGVSNVKVDAVVLGGMRNNGGAGKKLVFRQIFVDKTDLDNCAEMDKITGSVRAQIVPTEKGLTLSEMVKAYEKK